MLCQFASSFISRRVPCQFHLRRMIKQQKEAVTELQQLLRCTRPSGTGGAGDWDKCWEQGLTPWDLGGPTPVLAHLHKSGALPNGRALIPGCGTGYDVVEIACPDRHVTGLDISPNAVNKALELFSSLPNAKHFTFLKVDFFTWNPPDLFFCAIEPDMRAAWAQKTSDILKPDEELITLMFPIDDLVGGPPYKVTVSELVSAPDLSTIYEEVLHPMGFKAISIFDNDLAVQPRKGRKKLGRWKKSAAKSAL